MKNNKAVIGMDVYADAEILLPCHYMISGKMTRQSKMMSCHSLIVFITAAIPFIPTQNHLPELSGN